MSAARDIWGRFAALLAIAAIACVAVAGCGGDDDAPAAGGDARPAAETPEPRTYQAFAKQVAELLAEADDAGDCERLREISARSPQRLPCPAPAPLRERMSSFEPIDSQLYYTDRVGVVEYEPGAAGGPTSMVLLLDYDHRWTVQRLDINARQRPANGPQEGGATLKKTIRGWEAAVRRRNCEELLRLTYRPAGTPRPSCAAQLAASARLAKILKSDPGQRPAYNGGSQDFGFYSFTAYRPTATHHTITVVRTTFAGEDRFFVADVVRDESSKT